MLADFYPILISIFIAHANERIELEDAAKCTRLVNGALFCNSFLCI